MRYFLIVVDDKRVNLRELWEDDLIKGHNAWVSENFQSEGRAASDGQKVKGRDIWQEMIISRSNVPVEGWEQVAHRLNSALETPSGAPLTNPPASVAARRHSSMSFGS